MPFLPSGYDAVWISQKIASYPEHHLLELDLSQVNICNFILQYITFKGLGVQRNGMLTLCRSGILLVLKDDIEKVVQEVGRTYAFEMLL